MNGLKKLCTCFALSTTLALATPAFAVERDFAIASGPGNYHTKLDKKFADAVAATTHGDVKITIYTGGPASRGPRCSA